MRFYGKIRNIVKNQGYSEKIRDMAEKSGMWDIRSKKSGTWDIGVQNQGCGILENDLNPPYGVNVIFNSLKNL